MSGQIALLLTNTMLPATDYIMGVRVDYQTLFNAAVMVVGGLGGWVLGRITKSLDRLDADVRAMPLTYVAKIDYKSDVAEIREALHRIEDKLDRKIDK